MKILLMRHVLTQSREDAGVEFDAERPVSEEGKKHIELVRKALDGLGISVSRAVASPFRRSVETAELVMASYGGDLKVSPALVPGAGVDDLLKAILNNHSHLSDEEWVLAVCHEPDVSYILARLTSGEEPFPAKVMPGDIFALELRAGQQTADAEIVAALSPLRLCRSGNAVEKH